VAAEHGLPRVLLGVELLDPGPRGHAQGEEAPTPHPDHVQPHPRHGFRRPLRTPDPASSARRLFGPVRPIHLHGLRPGRGARLRPGLAPKALRVRPHPRSHALFSTPSQRRAGADPGRQTAAQVLRGRHGPGVEPRHYGELSDLPGTGPWGILSHGERVWLHCGGCHPGGLPTAGHRAASDPGASNAPTGWRWPAWTCESSRGP
jgi:hypothetical protein